MFIMISFPWPAPSANATLTGTPRTSNPLRVRHRQARDLELAGIRHGAHRSDNARDPKHQ